MRNYSKLRTKLHLPHSNGVCKFYCSGFVERGSPMAYSQKKLKRSLSGYWSPMRDFRCCKEKLCVKKNSH